MEGKLELIFFFQTSPAHYMHMYTCSVQNNNYYNSLCWLIPCLVEISCDPPNNRLDKLNGRLLYEGNQYPLDNENVILRVRYLHYGVVFFLFQ